MAPAATLEAVAAVRHPAGVGRGTPGEGDFGSQFRPEKSLVKGQHDNLHDRLPGTLTGDVEPPELPSDLSPKPVPPSPSRRAGPLELGDVVGEGGHGRFGRLEAPADLTRSPDGRPDLEVDGAQPKIGLHAQARPLAQPPGMLERDHPGPGRPERGLRQRW